MERQWALFSVAVALYVLSVLEVSPTFVTTATTGPFASTGSPSLRGAASGQSERPQPIAWRAGLQTASSLLVASACALAARARGARTKMLATSNPYTVYTVALENAAAKTEEGVAVTKDVMKAKNLFASEKFMDDMLFVMNDPALSELDRSKEMVKLFGAMESTVFPKFVVYLAKKRRLYMVQSICKEYISTLFEEQAILPVRVVSAEPLTEDEKEKIKEKMRAKTGASDIKLATSVEGALLAGFRLEWGFLDPQNMESPSEGLDLSLASYLKKAAIAEGVVM